jgi:serine protease Do
MDEFSRVLTAILYSALKKGEAVDTNRPAPGNIAGEPLQVTILRDGQTKTVNVTRIHSSIAGPLFWWQAPMSLRRDSFPEVFSIDARIRPDQCGGPVIDLDGRVVGIMIARADATRTLVLPTRVVQQVVSDLRRQAKQ